MCAPTPAETLSRVRPANSPAIGPQANRKQTQETLVTLAERPHPFPSRTRQLSSPAPKILRGQPFGKIGRRQGFCVNGPGALRATDGPGRESSSTSRPSLTTRPVDQTPAAGTGRNSVLAVPAVARGEAAGFSLREALPASRAGFAATVVDGQEVPHLCLECGRDAVSQDGDRVVQGRACGGI